MDPQSKARIIKIVPPNLYTIIDCKTNQTLKIQLVPVPQKPNFIHLLKNVSSESGVGYDILKKTAKFKDQYQKASIFLGEQNISSLYADDIQIPECHDQMAYEKDEILECYVLKVECLKLKLYLLEHKKYITFYFSELRLPRIQHSHPKEIWQKAQDYFMNEIYGQFVQIKINGSETYRDQLNIHGQILRLHDGLDLKQKIISEGYAELSKNADQYLSKGILEKYQKLIVESKGEKKGIWRGEKKNIKGSNQIMEQKFKIWEEWTKSKKKYSDIKNVQNQITQITNELKKNSGVKADPVKCRILLQVFLSIMDENINEKNMKNLQEFTKAVVSAFVNLQVNLSLHVDNLDFLKYINKVIILLIFYVTQEEKAKTNNKKMIVELEKIMKIVFKCCFIGNQTFHQKVFDKKKQFQFEKFSFDPADLSGISSFSEYSDYEDDFVKKESKHSKKITSAQTKIRMNSTLLLSHIFRLYSSIVQNHWEICVKPNVLTHDFFNYLSKLKINIESAKMSKQEKKNIVNLMRTNFGDYSLVLLIFFEQNKTVKKNALNCMINMIGNFQGRKMIDTTEAPYIEKLLKQTKSSFVPKSFIIFSGLRNALYFMLFSLHHEINIQIIVTTFKALTELCQQSTLIDKMGFMEGMGLLMSNYINPVLKFQWEQYESQLSELKTLCIEFLGALVSTQKKWEEMENDYLMSKGEKNINYCLLEVIEFKKKQQKNIEEDKIIQEITKYFMKMSKRYYSALYFELEKYTSVWSYISEFYISHPSILFTHFVEEVFKSHIDQLTLLKNHQNRKNEEYLEIAQISLKKFLNSFFPIYGKISTIQNYSSLINILTYIEYDRWEKDEYKKAKGFLLHCFQSLSGKSSNTYYPSLENLKSNPHVRIALIKLLGYMSFCEQFQKVQYCQQAIRSLLQYSKTYKSLNSIIKITWGISNWSNIPQLKECLSKEELKECLDYMIFHSKSDKEKIASNSTRGVGFFITNFSDIFQMETCRSAIIKNLSHSILKVRTNSTKTLKSMATKKLLGKDENEVAEIIQNLIPILEQNILRNNYHLQTETLLLIKELGNPIKPAHMLRIFSHILKDLLSQTTMEYQFSEIKALKQLRKIVLGEIVVMPCEFLKENEQAAKEVFLSIQNYLVDSQEEALRREAQNSKILDRGFEKGEEALNAVFNTQNERYDEEKMISTQVTLRGIRYKANEEDISLLEKIQSMSKVLSDLNGEWKQLSKIKIVDNEVQLDTS